jgi:hypothetical protein
MTFAVSKPSNRQAALRDIQRGIYEVSTIVYTAYRAHQTRKLMKAQMVKWGNS